MFALSSAIYYNKTINKFTIKGDQQMPRREEFTAYHTLSTKELENVRGGDIWNFWNILFPPTNNKKRG